MFLTQAIFPNFRKSANSCSNGAEKYRTVAIQVVCEKHTLQEEYHENLAS